MSTPGFALIVSVLHQIFLSSEAKVEPQTAICTKGTYCCLVPYNLVRQTRQDFLIRDCFIFLHRQYPAAIFF